METAQIRRIGIIRKIILGFDRKNTGKIGVIFFSGRKNAKRREK